MLHPLRESPVTIAHHSTKLPDPDERPAADLIIFDGQCRFCRGQVERLARWDYRQRLAFISVHDPRVRERFPNLTHEQLMQDMYLIDRRERRIVVPLREVSQLASASAVAVGTVAPYSRQPARMAMAIPSGGQASIPLGKNRYV